MSLANFCQISKYDYLYTKDFSWKKMTEIRQILKIKISNRQIFMVSSSK
jgi:hypothetical protein